MFLSLPGSKVTVRAHAHVVQQNGAQTDEKQIAKEHLFHYTTHVQGF